MSVNCCFGDACVYGKTDRTKEPCDSCICQYPGRPNTRDNFTPGDKFVDETYDPKSRYYDAGGIETLDIIKAKLTPEQYRGYLLGNVLKYACRLFHKGQPERDTEKLALYSKWLEEVSDDSKN